MTLRHFLAASAVFLVPAITQAAVSVSESSPFENITIVVDGKEIPYASGMNLAGKTFTFKAKIKSEWFARRSILRVGESTTCTVRAAAYTVVAMNTWEEGCYPLHTYTRKVDSLLPMVDWYYNRAWDLTTGVFSTSITVSDAEARSGFKLQALWGEYVASCSGECYYGTSGIDFSFDNSPMYGFTFDFGAVRMPPSFSGFTNDTPLTARTISATIRPQTDDIGVAGRIWVAAMLPNGQWYANTSGHWTQWTSGELPAYEPVNFFSSSHTFPVVSSALDLSGIVGTIVYVGYGRTQADMLANSKYSIIHTVR